MVPSKTDTASSGQIGGNGMSLRDNIADEALEMTREELEEYDEFNVEDEFAFEDEFRERVGQIHELFEIHAANIVLGRMFDEGRLTLGDYLELVDHLAEYERDLDVSVLG